MHKCSDMTPCKLPNKLNKTTQPIAAENDAFLVVTLDAILKVKKEVIQTSRTPASRMAIKLLPNNEMSMVKKAKVRGGFKSHNWV